MELHLTHFGVLYHLLHIEFHSFKSRIVFYGYHTKVPVINLIFSQTVYVPLMDTTA